MKKVLKKRTGFTLVELLIVIIIIGILAGAMLLVAGSGTDKAEATKIVSNLRSLKTAALMYYADNPNKEFPADEAIDELKKYMDRPLEAPSGKYVFDQGNEASGDWYVGLTDAEDYITAGIAAKLKDVNKDSGLLSDKIYDPDPENDEDWYQSGGEVWMRAR